MFKDKKIFKNIIGFTLMEISVTILIIGVIAGISIPKLSELFEQTKAKEGEEILKTILDAQLQYAVHNDINVADLKVQTGISGQEMEDLNISITPSSYFHNLTSQVNSDNIAYAGAITRSRNSVDLYTLYITWDGTIHCGGDSVHCSKLKYSPANL